MSHCHNDVFPERNNSPPSSFPVSLEDALSTVDPPAAGSTSAALSPPVESHLCTICVDTNESVVDRATIPACNHTFCLSCLLSWASVRETCPNCKASFTNLLVHRDLSGDVVPGPWTCHGQAPFIRESTVLLRRVKWVQLREVHSTQHDIQASFVMPQLDSTASGASAASSSSSVARHYLNEAVEDELEDRFWEEEQQQFDRLLGGTRVISNRRFGPTGYISSGRMSAKPRRPQPPKRLHLGSASASAGASASPKQQPTGSSSSGGRKKKVKKKSRAGIAAAKAAAEAEARNASMHAVDSTTAEDSGNTAWND